MSDESSGTSCKLEVSVAEDRYKAWVQVEGIGAPGCVPPTEEEVCELLLKSALTVDDAAKEKVRALVEACANVTAEGEQAPEPVQKFLVAECKQLPVDAVDGKFEWAPEFAAAFAAPEEDETIDYFAQNEIVTVDAGTVIGRLESPKNGLATVDVCGMERWPRKRKGSAVELGFGLQMAEDGSDQVVAKVAGRVLEEPFKLKICEVLELRKDVDFSSGSVDACVDTVVHGTVRANFSVHTTKSLTVDQVIEAADVRAEEDTLVRGGIFGQEQTGRVTVGGNLTVKLLNEAVVRAGGTIFFHKEILNSRVWAWGRLVGENATVIGGETYAREGVAVRVIGSEACVPTHVAVGIEVNTLRRIRHKQREIEKLSKSTEQIRKTIAPLSVNIKRLLPPQREQLTELMCKADEIELQLEQLLQECDRLLTEGTPEKPAGVAVYEAVHPGTHLVFGTREVRLQKLVHGPVRIELRKVNDVTEVAVVNQRTGSIFSLMSTEVDLDLPPQDDAAPENGRKDGTDEATVDDRHA